MATSDWQYIVKTNDIHSVQDLLHLDVPQPIIGNALHCACLYGRFEIAQMLLARFKLDCVPFIYSACKGASYEILRLLLLPIVDKSKIDSSLALKYACANGGLITINLILTTLGPFDFTDVLNYVCYMDPSLSVVQLLCQKGAQVQRALTIAYQQSNKDLIKILKNYSHV